MTVIITDKGKCSCNKKERDSQGNEVTERKMCKNGDCNCKEKRDKHNMDAMKLAYESEHRAEHEGRRDILKSKHSGQFGMPYAGVSTIGGSWYNG